MKRRRVTCQQFIFLTIALMPIIGSFGLHLGVDIAWLSCPLRRWLGVPCPAWGLTRSFIATAHGDWQQAIAFHLFGPLLFAGFLIAGVHQLLELWRGQPLTTFYGRWARQPKVQIVGFVMLCCYHGWRLALLAKTGELSTAFASSLVGHWLF